MRSSGDVLSVGSIQCLHHLDAEASTGSDKHGKFGHCGPGWELVWHHHARIAIALR